MRLELLPTPNPSLNRVLGVFVFVLQEDAWSQLKAGVSVPIAVYNPLSWSASRWVQVSVPVAGAKVLSASGDVVPSQVTCTSVMTEPCEHGADCSASTNGNPLYVHE